MSDEVSLLERVKELWEKNHIQKSMLDILHEEGYSVTLRQLQRLRSKNGLMLRASAPNEPGKSPENDPVGGHEVEQAKTAEPQIPLEVQIERQARQAKLWVESAEKLKNKTRRRRMRGWCGLPPDVGLPPRFPSELTLEESRALLDLDKTEHAELKKTFQSICETHGVQRKSGNAPGLWQFAKEELINASPKLQAVFRTPQAANHQPNKEPMALDVICMDVTKRIRQAGQAMSIMDAKNVLGLTPDETRDIRAAFQNILVETYFTKKLDVGKDHWNSLKRKWLERCPRLQREFQSEDTTDERNQRLRALEAIALDVSKRKRDTDAGRDPNAANKRKAAEKKTDDPTPKKARTTTEKETPARTRASKPKESPTGNPPWTLSSPPTSDPSQSGHVEQTHLSNHARASEPMIDHHHLHELAAAAQIDPDLLRAASLTSIMEPSTWTAPPPPSMSSNAQPQPSSPPNVPTAQDYRSQLSEAAATPSSTTTATPIYIRPSASSLERYPGLPKVWLDRLSSPTAVGKLHELIGRKIGLQARVDKIEGLVEGKDEKWGIDDDDEAEGFVNFARGEGGKVVFAVEIV